MIPESQAAGGGFEGPLVDHRIYTIVPRKMDAFLEVFDRLAMPILIECLGRPLGAYVSQVGTLNQFVHLWGYRDFADYGRRCHARDTHPDFPAYLEASAAYVTAQETRLLRGIELPSLVTSRGDGRSQRA
jgi:hypothetical protein